MNYPEYPADYALSEYQDKPLPTATVRGARQCLQSAADLLYDRVLPLYESLGLEVGAVLTDNGREFCGIHERHPHELLLAMEDIEHRTPRSAAHAPTAS